MKTRTIFLFAFFFLHFAFVWAQDTIYVRLDYSTIQQGIEAATDEDIVLVDSGSYLENINFNGKAITVASHFIVDGDTNHINNTIIDGSDPDDPDYGSAVTFITGEDTTSVLCGFTITGGSGMAEPKYGARIGGGIVCYYATAKIVSNLVTGNAVNSPDYSWGGGIACIRESGDNWMVISGNTITNNQSHANTGIPTGGGIEIWGNARISDNIIENNHCYNDEGGRSSGGGVLISSPVSPAASLYFHNNIVRNNMVETNMTGWGGGMYVKYSHCNITGNMFVYNTISGNAAIGGGLAVYKPASLTLDNNLCSHNQIIISADNNWWGAGFFCGTPSGETSITNNEFSYNSGSSNDNGRGGGICLRFAQENKVTVDANLIMQNTCFRGGGLYVQDSYNMLIVNNVFSENSSTGSNQGRGGGISMFHPNSESGYQAEYLIEYRPVVVNNTFYSNNADERGGGIRFSGELSPPVIFNCIFRENDAPVGSVIDNWSSSTLLVSYSDLDTNSINGAWTGYGNIDKDPGFIDENFHIDEYSPCVDVGADSLEFAGTWYYAPDHDFEGIPRPWWHGIDMGAHECDIITSVSDPKIQHLTLKTQIYPNPTRGIVDCRFGIVDCRRVSLKIFNLDGLEVASVLDEKLLAGEHVVQFDASSLPDGIYFVRVQVGSESVTGKIVKMQAY